MPGNADQLQEVHEDPHRLAAAMSADPAYDPADSRPGGGARHAAPPAQPCIEVGPVDLQRLPRAWRKVSRNGACPCGSGKKFKHCHGALV